MRKVIIAGLSPVGRLGQDAPTSSRPGQPVMSRRPAPPVPLPKPIPAGTAGVTGDAQTARPRSGPRAARPDLWVAATHMRRSQGMPLKEVAAHYERTPGTVSGWIRSFDYREREAIAASKEGTIMSSDSTQTAAAPTALAAARAWGASIGLRGIALALADGEAAVKIEALVLTAWMDGAQMALQGMMAPGLRQAASSPVAPPPG